MVRTRLSRDTATATVLDGPLVGDSVVLRRHRPENLAAFQRWYRDPEISRLTRYRTEPMSPEEVERYFRARVLGGDTLSFAIHRASDDRLIGSATFSQLDVANGSVTYHITIGERDCWGLGYGTEATELMLELAFERIGLHRVALAVFEFNERAIRSYEKAGFGIEGRLRDTIYRDGRHWDEISMSVLEPEWRAHRARVARERAQPERAARAS
jgi:RimJ/RimL family protein N-acetyltransferase